MPTGKVKWYDSDKGFGFIANDEGDDVYFHTSVVTNPELSIGAGQKVDFSMVAGRKGPQALSVTLQEPLPSVAKAMRRKNLKTINTDELHGMIEDMIKVLEADIQPELRRGKHPDSKISMSVAGVMRAVAKQLDV